jgi:hypothetical protein
MWKFVSNGKPNKDLTHIPFFEDQGKVDIMNYNESTKSRAVALSELLLEISNLDGYGVTYQYGTFLGLETVNRCGYVIDFYCEARMIRMRVLALPTKEPENEEQAVVQALLNMRDWLRASSVARVFSPGVDIMKLLQFVDENLASTLFLDTGEY